MVHDEESSTLASAQPSASADISRSGAASNPSCSDTSSSSTVTTCISPDTSLINERDPCHDPLIAKKFIDVGPFQPNNLNFPVTDGRKFRPEWYRTYPWLEYSSLKDKAFCFVCRATFQGITNKADDAFIIKGVCKWKKAISIFHNHQKSKSHLNNSVKLALLKQAEQTGNIAEKLSSQYSKDVEENRLYLHAVCESLIFCGRQAIPLRGHDETDSSRNKGNFLELMKLRCKDNVLVKRFFFDRQKNFQYTTGKFQNELLCIIGDQVKNNIADKVRESRIFALIADETQDISRHEQVAIVLRHVDDDLKVHESFIGFYRAEKTDAESLATLLKSIILSLNLDIQNLRAQCYDGAANMRGSYNGVASRILRDSPVAMYIHCRAHVLNLCIVSCCTGVTSIRNTFHVLQSLYNFIEKSPKRHGIFEKIQKCNQYFSGGTLTLKSLSDTRWYCRVEAVRSLLDNFETTIAALNEIAEIDPTYGGEANSLLKCIEDFNFIFNLLLLRRVLTQCDILSNTLQSCNINFGVVKDMVKSTVEVLETFRSDEFFQKLWNHCTQLAQKCDFKPAELPRTGRIPLRIGGGSKVPYETVEQYYKSTVLYPIVDILAQEMKNRFSDNNLDVLEHLSNVLNSSILNMSSVESVCRYYSLNKEPLIAELQCFYRMKAIHGKTIEERVRVCVEKKLKEVFPMVFELFRLYFTVPMNSASCERTFSCLRRLKTYCRNTTGQERLSSLALLAVERDISVDIDKIINEFDISHKRRLHFT